MGHWLQQFYINCTIRAEEGVNARAQRVAKPITFGRPRRLLSSRLSSYETRDTWTRSSSTLLMLHLPEALLLPGLLRLLEPLAIDIMQKLHAGEIAERTGLFLWDMQFKLDA